MVSGDVSRKTEARYLYAMSRIHDVYGTSGCLLTRYSTSRAIPRLAVKIDRIMAVNQPLASGSGLSHGLTGEVCKFHVKMPTITDESKGKLSMGISGPSKVVLDSQHTSDGFVVSYVPLEEGDYQLTIKCDGKHIPGSPFSVAVEKDPEFVPPSYPAKCRASGPGLKRGIALKPCYFSVNTGNAGSSVSFHGNCVVCLLVLHVR